MRLPSGGLVLLAFVGLATVAWAASSSFGGGDDELARQEERSVRCDLNRALRDSFAAFLDKIHDQLACRRITLKQAADQVYLYCRQCYPSYLDHLHLVENGTNVNEMIAQNLVRYFEPRPATRDQVPPQLLARLRAELNEILRERGPVTSSPVSGDDPRYTVQ